MEGETKDGEMTTSLVASKSRVAPLKRLTLPRLELMGAVIAARLASTLMKALQMDRTQLRLWTDSMIVCTGSAVLLRSGNSLYQTECWKSSL